MMRLLLLLSVTLLMTSCDLLNNFGKKVKIDDKNEVYFKGEGVTEGDAKKLGDFLQKMGYFNGVKESSVQLTKDADKYTVHFVYDKAAYDKNKEQLALIFWYWQDLLSENVFDSKKTAITLADDKLKDFETFEEVAKVKAGKHDQVYYKGKVSEKEAGEVAQQLEKAEFFTFTDNSILLTKEKGTYHISFMPNEEKLKESKEDYYRTLRNFQYLLGKYVIEDEAVKLSVLDNDFTVVKDFDELSSEEKTIMDQAMLRQQDATHQQTNNAYQHTGEKSGDDDAPSGGGK